MIIGSQAILYHFPNFPRKPKDIDCVIYEGETIPKSAIENPDNLRTEFLINPVLLDYCLKNNTHDGMYCSLDVLYTLKISHCFWDLENGSWNKHIWDIQWLKEKGCIFIPKLFYQLYNYWETMHGKNKRSNLNMSAEKFFDNVVNYPVEHDYLHELLVKHVYFEGNEPTYKKILKNGADVDVSEEKFNQLTEKEKFNLVIEEIMVMALERYSDMFYKKAFGKMLKKFILSHCPIWEGIWIIQNHKELMTNIPFDYFTHLKTQIKNYELQIN